jgi:hypothetical protein
MPFPRPTTYFYLAPRLRISGAILPLLLNTFVVYRDKFTFYLFYTNMKNARGFD